jgi:prephenate dehydrogenase
MRIAVVGLGLIGGSIALAARRRLGAEVSGIDRDRTVAEAALSAGALDHACEDFVQALAGAQAAFVAVPVGAIAQNVGTVLEHAPADCVVTDVGSTKRAIVAGHSDRRFVGGHPMAGSEQSGFGYARDDLFEHATWYLTPTAATSEAHYGRLRALVESIGARPTAIDPLSHDRLVATVSHLPHVVANALVAQARATLPRGTAVSSHGPSFRDATRVAGAPSAIWTDIYMTNADLLAAAVQDMAARLEAFREALLAGDRARIETFTQERRP